MAAANSKWGHGQAHGRDKHKDRAGTLNDRRLALEVELLEEQRKMRELRLKLEAKLDVKRNESGTIVGVGKRVVRARDGSRLRLGRDHHGSGSEHASRGKRVKQKRHGLGGAGGAEGE